MKYSLNYSKINIKISWNIYMNTRYYVMVQIQVYDICLKGVYETQSTFHNTIIDRIDTAARMNHTQLVGC